MEKIYGNLTDSHGRCIHYHSVLDIIANRCNICQKLYACYQCHNELENHEFSPVSRDTPNTVMCGVCGKFFSYSEYSKQKSCPDCNSNFNPACSKHCSIYSEIDVHGKSN